MHKENNTNNTTKLYTETWKPSISILHYSNCTRRSLLCLEALC